MVIDSSDERFAMPTQENSVKHGHGVRPADSSHRCVEHSGGVAIASRASDLLCMGVLGEWDFGFEGTAQPTICVA